MRTQIAKITTQITKIITQTARIIIICRIKTVAATITVPLIKLIPV